MPIGTSCTSVQAFAPSPKWPSLLRWFWGWWSENGFLFDVIFLIFFSIFPSKIVIPNHSKPIVYKVLNFFVQHFPKFVYLCPHQPKKNIPTQKITDYLTYWYKAFLLFKYCWNLDNFNLTTQESGTLTVYPWAFLFVVKVVQNRSNRQKFTDSFCDPSEGRSAQNAKP